MRAPELSLGDPLRVVGLLGHTMAERTTTTPANESTATD
jgi:hypothetical protein